MGINGLRGNLSFLDERIVVAEKGKRLSSYRDLHLMGLFDQERFLKIMGQAGLEAKHTKRSLDRGRGLFIRAKTPLS